VELELISARIRLTPFGFRAAMSTSVSYLRKRLADIGRYDLLDAADRGLVSVYACAEEAGLITRPEVQGNGSPNAAKRRAWALMRVTAGKSPLAPESEAEISQQPKFSQERNGSSRPTTPPNLAAALAEWEEAQKPAPPRDEEVLRAREPAPAALPNCVTDHTFPTHPALPCTNCNHPQATAALREVLDVYVAACRSEPHRIGSVLPRACCQWLRRPDVQAMIA